MAELIAAFEEQNTVFIELYVRRCTTKGEADLCLTASAWERNADRRVAKPLAYQSVRCRAELFKRMESAAFYLLYRLDFLLAEHEWEKTGGLREQPPARPQETDV